MFKKIVLSLVVLLLFCSELQAVDREIPLFFAYQGSLIDEGGNLLPDGKTEIKFKILDSLGNVLYEETQNLDIVKGEIAAIVGNGLDVSTGSPMGGIPMEALEPTGTRYLQLEAQGYLPYDKLEIVTAPYAIWADTALKMPEGSITSAMLGKGIITKDHLNEELMSAVYPDGIPKSMLPADTYYGSVMKGPTGAGLVGVTPSFYNSGSGTVQGVLKDLDFAILKGSEAVKYEKKVAGDALNAEKVDRTTKDTALQKEIDDEEGARTTEDTALQGQITGHAGTTSAHGANGTLVGSNDLATKVSKSGDSINGSLSMRTTAGVETILIDGQSGAMTAKTVYAGTDVITAKVSATDVVANNISVGGNSAFPNSNNDVTNRGQAKAWGSIKNAAGSGGNGPSFYDSYNTESVTYSWDGIYTVKFKKPFTSNRYIAIPQSDFPGWGSGINIHIFNKTVSDFQCITTDGGTDRHGDIDWQFVVYGTLEN